MKKNKQTAVTAIVAEDKSYFNFDQFNANTGANDDKDFKNTPVQSRFQYDLFKEEDYNIVEKVIRIKHTRSPSKGDRWKVFENDENVFILEGSKISKKERAFLKSYEGFTFLISQAKDGIRSFHDIHKKLKSFLLSKKTAK